MAVPLEPAFKAGVPFRRLRKTVAFISLWACHAMTARTAERQKKAPSRLHPGKGLDIRFQLCLEVRSGVSFRIAIAAHQLFRRSVPPQRLTDRSWRLKSSRQAVGSSGG